MAEANRNLRCRLKYDLYVMTMLFPGNAMFLVYFKCSVFVVITSPNFETHEKIRFAAKITNVCVMLKTSKKLSCYYKIVKNFLNLYQNEPMTSFPNLRRLKAFSLEKCFCLRCSGFCQIV